MNELKRFAAGVLPLAIWFGVGKLAALTNTEAVLLALAAVALMGYDRLSTKVEALERRLADRDPA